MIEPVTLSKYAIRLHHWFDDDEDFDTKWTQLMENDVDCYVDVGQHNSYPGWVIIYFKSNKDKQLAINILTIVG